MTDRTPPGAEEIPLAARPPARPDRPADRPPSRSERRAEATRMITVLAGALAGRFAELDAATERAPRGWWFTPERRR